MQSLKPIDHTAMSVHQVIIIALNITAFVLNQFWLVAWVAVVMLVGALLGRPGFGFVYQYLLKPTGWVKSHLLPDNPEPHRFAQGLGGAFMLCGTVALFSGFSSLGWGLVWMVAVLAALNVFGGFCLGCFVYYWLSRLGVPGFSKNPLPDTFPGMRPKGVKHDEH